MSDAMERVKATAARTKMFPLPSAVLFPGAMLPLHIFEPRYRELVRDAVKGDRVMALGGLAEGWESNYAGRPELLPLCCVGTIAWHEEVEEGRFNILLTGVTRAKVLKEVTAATLYREVSLELLPDAPYDGPEVEALRNAVLELAAGLPQATAQLLVQQAVRAQGGELADLVASAVVPDPDRRRALLGTLSVKARLDAVMVDISDVLARARTAPPGGPLN